MANKHDHSRDVNRNDGDKNPDPITGAAGSHPVGTGVGAAGGAATGALVGAAGGPVGAVVGGVAGAVVGGLIGKGISESVDPTEDAYWRDEYTRRPYYRSGRRYEDYEPAYRLGYRSFEVRGGTYDDKLEDEMRQTYEGSGWRGESTLEWDEARGAARDAYMRRCELKSRGNEV